MASNDQTYAGNGVVLSKSAVSVGDKVILTYSGLLAQNGAEYLFAHIGYGDIWEDKSFIHMEEENGVFTASFKVAKAPSVNIAFKDGADNWDNNSGSDYSFPVTDKAAKKAPAEKKVKAEKAAKAAVTEKAAKPAKAPKAEKVAKPAKAVKVKASEDKPAKTPRKKKEA